MCMALATDPTRVEGADPMVPRFMPVRDIWDETDDTFTLDLDPGPDGFAFRPGQFNMLYVFGVGEVPISISGDPAVPGRILHTVRGVGPVTTAMRDLVVGDLIGVRGPFGTPGRSGWLPVEMWSSLPGVSVWHPFVRLSTTCSTIEPSTNGSRCCTACGRPAICCSKTRCRSGGAVSTWR